MYRGPIINIPLFEHNPVCFIRTRVLSLSNPSRQNVLDLTMCYAVFCTVVITENRAVFD